MKKSKKILISAFAGAFLCAALGGAALCGNQKTVSAVAETPALTTFKTEDGASVRKDDNYGIRFRASISEDEYQGVQSYAKANNLSAVFGMLVCPQWVLNEKGGELAFDNAAIADYIKDVPVQVWETEKHTQYACAIVDYPDEKAALTTALTARAYVKDKSGNNHVVYADGTATRSLLQTTLAAKANGEEGASLDSIVEKAWQGENPAADYDFSSVIDYDLTKVSAYNGGTVKGIVADSAAADGFALLGNTDNINKDANGAWIVNGFSIAMGNIPVAKYSEINVYLRTNDYFSIYANDVQLKYEKYDSYTKVNLIELINKQSTAITELNEISFRRNAVNVSIYVDKIEFVQKPYNYDFSSADDNDIYAVSSFNGGSISGIVADSAATNKFALLGNTDKKQDANGAWLETGFSIAMGNIPVADYSAINVYLRTSDSFSIYANGINLVFEAKHNAYASVNLVALIKAKNAAITELNEISFRRNAVNVSIYVDKIVFIEKQVYNYDFSSADDNDIHAVSVYSTGTIEGIVADSAAKDGYALKITTGTQNGNGGAFINFDDLDVSKYEKITIRLRTETSNTAANLKQIKIGANGANYIGGYGMYSEYTEIDVVHYLQENSIAVLYSLAIYRDVPNITVYIDYIEFVKA